MRFAFDKSARSYDADGRLHVRVSNISKAMVSPYYGREIPDADKLGLEPAKVYHLLRDPDELAKAAPTFNNLPLLSRHVPVSAEEHMPDLVVGSLGTDAQFAAPYLRNSLVVWAQPAIDGIETQEQQELSASYRYVADMTPGTYEGLHFDGVMRNIVGNHVALVTEGRAGSDVVVSDAMPEGFSMLKSRRALMLQGALTALIAPKLAADAKFSPAPYLVGVNARNYGVTTKRLPQRILDAVAPKLAADEGLDVDDIIKVIGAVSGNGMEPDGDEMDEPPAVDAEGDKMAQVMAWLKGKLSDEDMAELAKMTSGEEPAKDADPAMEPEKKGDVVGLTKQKDDQPAMDAKAVMRNMNEIRQAEIAVRPYVGEIAVAMDSAADYYRLALDAVGVEHATAPDSALPHMLALCPKPGSTPAAAAPRVALDAASATSYRKRFPEARPLKTA